MPTDKEQIDIDDASINEETLTIDEIEKKQKQPHKGIYLLPNMFTTAALFAGFYAIIAAMNGNFIQASVAVFLAMILDGLDGRVARMTGTQSAFGAEYDSLSDMVSFGIAPALVAFTWALAPLGKIGWIAAFIYAVGAALRLARFNTMLGIEEKRYFTGLPSPSAAAIIAGVIWAANDAGIEPSSISIFMVFLVPITGLLMVSNIKYRSFKDLNLKGNVPFFKLLCGVFVLVLVAWNPALVLMTAFCVYGISGPIGMLMKRVSKSS